MTAQTLNGAETEYNGLVEAFLLDWRRNGEADLRDFLPAPEHGNYAAMVQELIRTDLAERWSRGQPRRLESYRTDFPELFNQPERMAPLALEEYAQRALAGEKPTALEYAQRYGITTSTWPLPEEAAQQARERAKAQAAAESDGDLDLAKTVVIPRFAGLEQAAAAYWEYRLRHEDDRFEIDSLDEDFKASGEPAEVFREIHRFDPEAAYRLARALTTLPDPPAEFLGFRLIEELGRGTFGRVYLAQQGDLAHRYVALKVSTDLFGESQALARLQHTNVVPIYSVHRAPPFQAVCMPYFGSTTLADVLQDVQGNQLPSSGKALLSTIQHRRSRTNLEGSDTSDSLPGKKKPSSTSHASPPSAVPKSAAYTAHLKMLEGLSYIDAVLWMACRLTDGLAHAHDRGILHRDLKPANVLLTDEGQPMLLDFNLCEDSSLRSSPTAAFVGGTLPYMSPEHLDAFRTSGRAPDARGDIYSLGVILYELLAGRHPFPTRKGTMRAILDEMIADRQLPAPLIRPHNKEVTPAVESIVRHCLEPDPGRRYQSARELQEDLQRQLDHRPLKNAREPSLKERGRKWFRRHPRLITSVAVGMVAALLMLGGTALVLHGRQQARQEALETYKKFREDLAGVQFLFTSPTPDRRRLDEIIARSRATLAHYAVLNNPRWQEAPAVTQLPDRERNNLEDDVTRLLVMLSRGVALRGEQPGVERDAQIRLALDLNGQAGGGHSAERTPYAVWEQRADLTRLLGDKSDARLIGKATEPETARDYYLVGQDYVVQGRFQEALPMLRKAVRLDPQVFWSWYTLGYCHDYFAQSEQAAACYSTCIALQPDSAFAYYNRGLAYLRQGIYEDARADFDQAIALRPTMAEAYLNRALARRGLKDLAGGIDDLNKALDRGSSETRIYFMRARIRELAGDLDGARRDREEGLKREPEDEKSYVARGLALLSTDPKAALADFEKACQLCPRSLPAMENRAHVLAEKLNRTQDSIDALTAILALYPDRVEARSSRGVLLARLGRRESAHADAEESLQRSNRLPIIYQVAGIYALTSRDKPEDHAEAFRLLSTSLRNGYGFDLLEKDPDLEPIRNLPEFHRLVQAAKSLAPVNSVKPK